MLTAPLLHFNLYYYTNEDVAMVLTSLKTFFNL
jgi:hypothetical protein